jgi:hypothetical protein
MYLATSCTDLDILSYYPCYSLYSLFITAYITICIHDKQNYQTNHSDTNTEWLNLRNQCWVLQADGWWKSNGPLCQCLVNSAFCTIQRLLSQLILFTCMWVNILGLYEMLRTTATLCLSLTVLTLYFRAAYWLALPRHRRTVTCCCWFTGICTVECTWQFVQQNARDNLYSRMHVTTESADDNVQKQPKSIQTKCAKQYIAIHCMTLINEVIKGQLLLVTSCALIYHIYCWTTQQLSIAAGSDQQYR